MKLNIIDRLILLEILPKQGDFITLSVVKELADKINIKEEEFKIYGITRIPSLDGGTTYKWDDKKAKIEKDFNITDTAQQIISDAFKTLNDQKKLTIGMMGTYKKFA
ncbi:unnamed protein product, partial [marine sediment metagenome]